MICLFRFEDKKFAIAVSDVVRCIEERIQQWSEYENSLERLLAWLTDAETSLKNYCLKNTFEEKQEQLEKYQVSSKLLQRSCVTEMRFFGFTYMNFISVLFNEYQLYKNRFVFIPYHRTFLTDI